MLTLEHLRRALKNATACDSPGSPELLSTQSLHQQRSSEWVRCLAHELKTLVKDEGNVRLLFRNNPDEQNRADFGLNELLYDVCVVRTAEHPSARGGRSLRHVTEALWLVESEFARDSLQAVKDFNKLGSATPRTSSSSARGSAPPTKPATSTRCSPSPAPAPPTAPAASTPRSSPTPASGATPDVADVTLHRYARAGWETL